MDDADDADSWEELEIEVSNLRTGATVEKTVSGVPAERSASSLSLAPHAGGREGERPYGERTKLARNGAIAERGRGARTWRRRMSGAAVVMVVVLVLVGLLISNPGVSARLRTDLFPPTPTLVPGSDTVWVRDTVPWGKLAIDGHTRMAVDAPTPLSLARGRHTLTYDAPPFRALRCTVSVPASRADTCPQDTHVQDEPNPPPAGERVLDLGATPDKLPASSYTALVAALQRQLDTATTTAKLLPGDHYGTPAGQVRVAQQPMTVTLAFVVAPPNPAGASESINGAACNPLCAVDTSGGQTLIGWQITASVNAQWQYTDTDGTPQVVSSPATGATQTGNYGNFLTFNVRPAGADWQAAINSYNSQSGVASVECDAAMQGLPPMQIATGTSTGFTMQPQSMNTGTPAAEGCAIALLPVNGNGSASGPIGMLLLRGGALVAANDTAHTLYPMLPLASAHEVALAYQLNTGTSG